MQDFILFSNKCKRIHAVHTHTHTRTHTAHTHTAHTQLSWLAHCGCLDTCSNRASLLCHASCKIL